MNTYIDYLPRELVKILHDYNEYNRLFGMINVILDRNYKEYFPVDPDLTINIIITFDGIKNRTWFVFLKSQLDKFIKQCYSGNSSSSNNSDYDDIYLSQQYHNNTYYLSHSFKENILCLMDNFKVTTYTGISMFVIINKLRDTLLYI